MPTLCSKEDTQEQTGRESLFSHLSKYSQLPVFPSVSLYPLKLLSFKYQASQNKTQGRVGLDNSVS